LPDACSITLGFVVKACQSALDGLGDDPAFCWDEIAIKRNQS
jgi:hypothetical protein